MLLLLALLSSVTTSNSQRPVAADPLPHVRPLNTDAMTVVEAARRRSATARRLIDRIARSDVVVYVEVIHDTAVSGAATVLLNGATGHRYLLVTINANHVFGDLVALLGHELEHAVEVARDPSVRDQAGMLALYRRIGVPSGTANHFETATAAATGVKIRKELSKGSSRRHVPRVLRISKWRGDY